MTKKLFVLITTITGCVGAIASALITYFQVGNVPAITGAITIGVTAIADAMVLFVVPEDKK